MFVDYRCDHCGGLSERRVPSPPPPTARCAACGAAARRVFSPPALRRAAAGPAGEAAPPPPAECLANRDVPALCHLDPSVAPAWIARARRDNQSLERELARQEAGGPAGAAPALASHHHRDPGHRHGPVPNCDTSASPSGLKLSGKEPH